MYYFLLLLLLCPFSAVASGMETLLPGTVAMVNGQAITLRQIEAFHDVSGDALVMAQSPSVELLQEQYGAILFALVVQTLVQQELERRNLDISDEDVRVAEAKVRADYSTPELFEEELKESFIELPAWRELMRRRLATQRFQQVVLRPRFTITPEEVETYYRAHMSLFQYPEQVELIWIQDMDRAVVEQLRARWIKEQSQKNAEAKSEKPQENVWDANRMRVGPERLPSQLRKDLALVKPGQATQVRQEGGLHQFAVLCRTIPARKLSAVEAFPAIERTLIESRLDSVYADWITEILPKAVIQIAPGLQPGQLDVEKKTDEVRMRREEAARLQEEEDGVEKISDRSRTQKNAPAKENTSKP